MALLCGPQIPVPKGSAPYRPYVGSLLKSGDRDDYSAAGLLAYRISDVGTVDVLLGRQMARGKGPSRRGTWSFIGGKREEHESCSMTTAAREAHEETMGCLTANFVEASLRTDPKVLWNPIGGYAIHLAEVQAENGGAVADALSLLPTGRELPLRRPPISESDAASDLSFAVVRSILDEVGGGPMLLSRLMARLYELRPESRLEVKEAGGAATWCHERGLLTARGKKGTVGQETAWLGRADTLEVDSLIWLPWLLIATRQDYTEPLYLRNQNVRIHPFFGSILAAESGKMLREEFARVQEVARDRNSR